MNVRVKEINRIRDNLEKEIEARKRLSKRYKIIYNSFHGIAVGSSGLSATLAVVSLGVMTSPVALIPLVSANVVLAGVGALTGFCSKLFVKRNKKHDKLQLLGNSVLNIINQILSKSLTDNHFSDEEFQNILKEYQEYIRMRKSIKDGFIDRTFVKKAKIKEDIDKNFSK